MSQKAQLVRGRDPRMGTYIAKAGAPDWVDAGLPLPAKVELGLCSIAVVASLCFVGLVSSVITAAPLYVPALFVLAFPGMGVLAWRGLRYSVELKYWTIALHSEAAVNLIEEVGKLQDVGRKYDLDSAMTSGWETRLLEAARTVEDTSIELERCKQEIKDVGSGGVEYRRVLDGRIAELEAQIEPVLAAAHKLVGEVKELGYAKKAAELQGLSLPVSPAQVAALSLLDEVDRVRELTRAYTQLALVERVEEG